MDKEITVILTELQAACVLEGLMFLHQFFEQSGLFSHYTKDDVRQSVLEIGQQLKEKIDVFKKEE